MTAVTVTESATSAASADDSLIWISAGEPSGTGFCTAERETVGVDWAWAGGASGNSIVPRISAPRRRGRVERRRGRAAARSRAGERPAGGVTMPGLPRLSEAETGGLGGAGNAGGSPCAFRENPIMFSKPLNRICLTSLSRNWPAWSCGSAGPFSPAAPVRTPSPSPLPPGTSGTTGAGISRYIREAKVAVNGGCCRYAAGVAAGHGRRVATLSIFFSILEVFLQSTGAPGGCPCWQSSRTCGCAGGARQLWHESRRLYYRDFRVTCG